MFASLGHWNTAVYVVLALHFVPVWLVSPIIILNLIMVNFIMNSIFIKMANVLVKLPSWCPH